MMLITAVLERVEVKNGKRFHVLFGMIKSMGGYLYGLINQLPETV